MSKRIMKIKIQNIKKITMMNKNMNKNKNKNKTIKMNKNMSKILNEIHM